MFSNYANSFFILRYLLIDVIICYVNSLYYTFLVILSHMKVCRGEFHHGLFSQRVIMKIKEFTFVFDLQMLYKKKYFIYSYQNLDQILCYELNLKYFYLFTMIQISSLSWHTKSVQLLSDPVDELIARSYEKV